jgi:signal transduction histidine kinase
MATSHHAPAAAAQPRLTRADGSPIRAVVVDDEDSLTDLLSMALRYEGWDVRLATDGKQAVSTIRDFRPDVVVLDVMLPDIDGLSVLSRLARLDEGSTLESLDLDLGRLLVDAVSDARVSGPDHAWSLDLPDEPMLVPGDRARIHQVLINLLMNARTHTPNGTAIATSLTRRGDDAVIEVTDTGPGMDPAIVPTIFERFVRGDGSRSRASGSTGLGLAIVSAVVEAHGGRAEVESAPGRTVFRVILPGRLG